MNTNIHNNNHHHHQLPPAWCIERLEEIIRNCQQNEQRLHELERHARHERKKAEKLLREAYRKKQEREQQFSVTSLNESSRSRQSSQPPVEYFLRFDNENNISTINQESRRQNNSWTENNDTQTPRVVRSDIPEKDQDQTDIQENNDRLTDLERRCEHLRSRLQSQRNQTAISDDSLNYPDQISSHHETDPLISLQQSLERFRPRFISHSRQRLEHVHHLREEREQHHQSILSSLSESLIQQQQQPRHQTTPRTHIPSTYREMKRASTIKYNQLPEVNSRLQQIIKDEIKHRNLLRAKLFQIRLRQHIISNGRTNIDESVTMVDI